MSRGAEIAWVAGRCSSLDLQRRQRQPRRPRRPRRLRTRGAAAGPRAADGAGARRAQRAARQPGRDVALEPLGGGRAGRDRARIRLRVGTSQSRPGAAGRASEAAISDVVRSGEVLLDSPFGVVATTGVEQLPPFVWRAVAGAASYRVEVRDVAGDLLWQGSSTATTLAAPPDLAGEARDARDLSLERDRPRCRGERRGAFGPGELPPRAARELIRSPRSRPAPAAAAATSASRAHRPRAIAAQRRRRASARRRRAA